MFQTIRLPCRVTFAGLLLIAGIAAAQDTAPSARPTVVEPQNHPSALRAEESSYASQPLWAQRLAADQAARREQIRLQGFEPMRPNAGTMAIWNLRPYHRATFFYFPVIAY